MNFHQYASIGIAFFVWVLMVHTGCVTEPVNRDPTVSSIVAFPNPAQQSDSFLVTCNAHDRDGDALTYDWSCGINQASIKGAPPEKPYELKGSRDNMRVFYAPDSIPCVITPDCIICMNSHAAIFCDVRDGKGGLKTVTITVPILRKQDE
jgi:hypothetical protein